MIGRTRWLLTAVAIAGLTAIYSFGIRPSADTVVSSITVNFDELSTGLFDPHQYLNQGITITSNGTTPNVWSTTEASSVPNFLVGQSSFSPIDVAFTYPTTVESVTVISAGHSTVTVTTFDEAGAILETYAVSNPDGPANGQDNRDIVTFVASQSTTLLTFVSDISSSVDGFGIDDLVISRETTVTTEPPPELAPAPDSPPAPAEPPPIPSEEGTPTPPLETTSPPVTVLPTESEPAPVPAVETITDTETTPPPVAATVTIGPVAQAIPDVSDEQAVTPPAAPTPTAAAPVPQVPSAATPTVTDPTDETLRLPAAVPTPPYLVTRPDVATPSSQSAATRTAPTVAGGETVTVTLGEAESPPANLTVSIDATPVVEIASLPVTQELSIPIPSDLEAGPHRVTIASPAWSTPIEFPLLVTAPAELSTRDLTSAFSILLLGVLTLSCLVTVLVPALRRRRRTPVTSLPNPY